MRFSPKQYRSFEHNKRQLSNYGTFLTPEILAIVFFIHVRIAKQVVG